MRALGRFACSSEFSKVIRSDEQKQIRLAARDRERDFMLLLIFNLLVCFFFLIYISVNQVGLNLLFIIFLGFSDSETGDAKNQSLAVSNRPNGQFALCRIQGRSARANFRKNASSSIALQCAWLYIMRTT